MRRQLLLLNSMADTFTSCVFINYSIARFMKTDMHILKTVHFPALVDVCDQFYGILYGTALNLVLVVSVKLPPQFIFRKQQIKWTKQNKIALKQEWIL